LQKSVRTAHTQQHSKEIGEMDKPAQKHTGFFLNSARKEKTPITIYLLSGVKLTGRIRSFDKYSVVPRRQRPGAAHLQARHLYAGYAEIAWRRFGLHPARRCARP